MSLVPAKSSQGRTEWRVPAPSYRDRVWSFVPASLESFLGHVSTERRTVTLLLPRRSEPCAAVTRPKHISPIGYSILQKKKPLEAARWNSLWQFDVVSGSGLSGGDLKSFFVIRSELLLRIPFSRNDAEGVCIGPFQFI